MIVNPDKFQAIIINRHGHFDPVNEHQLKFNDYEITSKNSVTLLGIEIDDRVSFDNYTHTLARKAAGQLNYLISKRHCLSQEAKQVLIQSFIMANFNYCPLVWLFCSKKLQDKQESIQKRALRFLYNDYESNYEHLLSMSNKPSIEVRKLRFLVVEIFKTIKYLNPSYMKQIFTINTTRDSSSNKLFVKARKNKKYGQNSLKSLGQQIWNALPNEMRNSESLFTFKRLIKTWSGPSCQCSLCDAHN